MFFIFVTKLTRYLNLNANFKKILCMHLCEVKVWVNFIYEIL